MNKRRIRLSLVRTVVEATTTQDAGGGDAASTASDTVVSEQQTATANVATTASTAAAATTSGDNLPDDVAELKKMISNLRSENAKSRTQARDQAATTAKDELVQQIGKALGLIKDNEPIDATKLTEQLSSQQATNLDLKRQLAVFMIAPEGTPIRSLMDSISFNEKIKALDPTNADFSSQVLEAIKAATAANPQPTKPGATKGGNELSGGPGGATQVTEAELASMTPEQIAEAMEQGRLQNLL